MANFSARLRAGHARPRSFATLPHLRIRRRTLGVMALTGTAVALAASASPAMATTADCANPATLSGSAFEIDTNANLVVNASTGSPAEPGRRSGPAC